MNQIYRERGKMDAEEQKNMYELYFLKEFVTGLDKTSLDNLELKT
jgi:hypothetical protein